MLSPKQRVDLSNTHRLVLDNLAESAKNHVNLCNLMRSMGETRLAGIHAGIAEMLIFAAEQLKAEEDEFNGQDRKAG